MFELLFSGIAIYELIKWITRSAALPGVSSPPNLAKNWSPLAYNSTILRAGAHYPISLSLTGTPNRANIVAILASVLDSPHVYFPGDAIKGNELPNPAPAGWLDAWRKGDAIAFGASKPSGVDGSSQLPLPALKAVGVDAATVWTPTEDFVAASVTPGRVNTNA